jgi:hypothetical protein
MVFQKIKGQNSRMEKSWSKIELGLPSKTCTAFQVHVLVIKYQIA